jgi:hypothetical protein
MTLTSVITNSDRIRPGKYAPGEKPKPKPKPKKKPARGRGTKKGSNILDT